VSRGRWTLVANAGLGLFASVSALRVAWALLRETDPGEAAWVVAADTVRSDWRGMALVALLLTPLGGAAIASLPPLRALGRSRSALSVVLLLAVLPFAAATTLSKIHPPAFRDATRESGASAPRTLGTDSFDFVAADFDGDGDADLLVNHHNLHSPVLLVHRGDGRFEDATADSGLLDAAGVGEVLGEPPVEGGAGEFRLWHDRPAAPERLGRWRVHWRPGASHHGRIRTDAKILRVHSLGVGTDASVEEAGAVLRFASAGIEKGGIEFETEWLEGAYEFDLLVGGERTAPSVRIGPAGNAPASIPFRLRLTDRHGGVAGDLDGDGRVDLYFACGARLGTLAPAGEGKADLLFRGLGGPRFSLVEGALGASDPSGRGRSCAWVDLDGDGAGELYVTDLVGPNRLYRRSEGGGFVEEAGRRGLALEDRSAFEFLDLDGDGDLDLLAAPPVTVLRNEAGTFTEVPGRMGLPALEPPPPERRGVFPEPAIVAEDVDGDGDLDLYLGDRLYLREASGFLDVTERAGLAPGGRVVAAAFGDYDNDGDRDLYLVRATGSNRLFRNEGGVFADVSRKAGIRRGRRSGITAGWIDANGDGSLDLFALDRALPDLWASACGTAGPQVLFRNRTNANGWIALDLRLRRPGGSVHGTRVEVRTRTGAQVRFAGLSERTVHSRSLLPLHFGLGRDREARSVEIRWPSGRLQRLEDVPGGRVLRAEER